MKCRAFTFLIVAFVVAVPPQAAAIAADQVKEFLLSLHAQLERVRSTAAPQATDLQRPELTDLVGLQRSQLARMLGAPDWCRPPSDNGCSDSRHWAYFFYRWQPSSHAAADGMTEVTMPLGGWAVEVDFSNQGLVTAASWVQQR
jgi:hypothetical protein